jgi:hypothetical protein
MIRRSRNDYAATELRNGFLKKLGVKLNIKSLHDAVLFGGAMPMSTLAGFKGTMGQDWDWGLK